MEDIPESANEEDAGAQRKIISDDKSKVIDDDISIAEEFNVNEAHIFADLAKREGEKLIIQNRPSNLSTPKSGIKKLALTFSRKRSVTFNLIPNGRGLFQRADVKKSPSEKKHSADIQQITCKEKENGSKSNKRSRKHTETSAAIKEKVRNEVKAALNNTYSKCMHRERTTSIDETVAYMSEVTNKKTDKERKANNATPTNSNYKMAKGAPNRGLKEKVSRLVNKGAKKFCNTTQALPKAPHKKSEIEDTLQYSERPVKANFPVRSIIKMEDLALL